MPPDLNELRAAVEFGETNRLVIVPMKVTDLRSLIDYTEQLRENDRRAADEVGAHRSLSADLQTHWQELEDERDSLRAEGERLRFQLDRESRDWADRAREQVADELTAAEAEVGRLQKELAEEEDAATALVSSTAETALGWRDLCDKLAEALRQVAEDDKYCGWCRYDPRIDGHKADCMVSAAIAFYKERK